MPASYIPLGGRVRLAVLALSFAALLAAAAIGFGLAELNVIDRIQAGEPVSDADLTAIDDRNLGMAIVGFAVWIFAAAAFIRWLHAAYFNVDVVAAAERRYGHGWAIGSWFVPILNFWRPKQIVNDIWRAGGRDVQDAQPGWLLLSWWGLWLFCDVVLRIAGGRYGGADTPEEWRTGTIIFLVGDGLSLIAAFLAIAVVRSSTDRLDGRAAAKAAPPPEPPADEPAEPPVPAGATS
jgi:hypothetical protein